MTRKRYVWDPNAKGILGKGAMVEVSTDYVQPEHHHFVLPDTPDYVSPVTGQLVSGRRQRRDDLARTASRPWEGMEQERKHAEKVRAEHHAKSEAKLEQHVRQAYHQLSPEKRRHLERG